jgi:dihydroflavonol-4-reductase
MDGCDVVYYCVVDARPWLLDPTPLWRTNVDGLRNVLDVAVDADLTRFVFTSSIGTIGRSEHGLADETTAHNWLDVGGDYIRTRVVAEEMVLRSYTGKGLPGVAMCVANTFGPGDWLPTPHGGLLAAAVHGKLPFYIDGYDSEVVGIEDAAAAMVLAGEHGRIGQRYIVSERFMSTHEIHEIACKAVGVAAPKWGIPIRVMSAAGYVGGAVGKLRGKDTKLTALNVRLMHIMTPLDHSKAVRELGWQPRPTPESIVAAAHFFRDSHRGPVAAEESR